MSQIKLICRKIVIPTSPNLKLWLLNNLILFAWYSGVPAVVDLAAMRDAMHRLGGDPAKINPLVPVDLVIDHSVQVDAAGTANAKD